MNGDTLDTTKLEAYCPACERSFAVSVTTCPRDGASLVVLDGRDPLIDRTLDGRFRIVKRRGQGGMGVVYEAIQASLGRSVAVKLVTANADISAEKRFLREARLASRLSHPNIVTVYDFGKSEGRLFIAMELLEGPTLSELLRAGRRFSPAEVVHLGVQICDALEAAHQLDIVHRDLKPGNIILLEPDTRKQVKVLDFGLAKTLDADQTQVTASRQLVGTPAYMAPELLIGEPTTKASDLYALGVLLYELLAGVRLFKAVHAAQLLEKHAQEAVPALPAEVPQSLARVVYTLLAKRPADRPPDAAAARAALLATGLCATSVVMLPRATGIEVPPPLDLLRAEAPTVSLATSSPVAEASRPPHRFGRRMVVALTATAAAIAGGFAIWQCNGERQAPMPTPQSTRVEAVDRSPEPAGATMHRTLDAAAPSVRASTDATEPPARVSIDAEPVKASPAKSRRSRTHQSRRRQRSRQRSTRNQPKAKPTQPRPADPVRRPPIDDAPMEP